MRPVKDLTGQTFDQLTVIRRASDKGDKRIYWECRCACGTITIVMRNNLRRGTKSCGCWRRAQASRQSANFLDLTGQPFGNLTVLKRAPDTRKGHARWECLCTCGKTTVVASSELRKGSTMSCGCLRNEVSRRRQTTHGMSRRPEYGVFYSIQTRCTSPKHIAYARYGGRGIKVEWETFEAFYADMGPRPGPEFTIERKDNDGNYSKENCKWATPKEQANNRYNNRRISYQGIVYTLQQLADHLGIHPKTLDTRLKRGYIVR